MRSAIKRASYFLSSLLLLVGVILWLTLPNVSFSASSTSIGNRLLALDSQRQSALEKLRAQFNAGAPFAAEEQDILNRFGASQPITDLEADVLISRALYDYYVADQPLSKEQQDLLSRYQQSVSRRDHDIADRKAQLLKAREQTAAAAGPRTTPLVASVMSAVTVVRYGNGPAAGITSAPAILLCRLVRPASREASGIDSLQTRPRR